MRIAKLAAVVVGVVGSIVAGTAGAEDRFDAMRVILAEATAQAIPENAAPEPVRPAMSHPVLDVPVAQASPPEAAEPSPPRRARPAPPRRDPRVDTSECAWVGKRTIRVLMRDDLIAAEGFLKFYNAFGCPVRYLGQAFGCALAGTDGAPAKDVENRIEACWKSPTAKLDASGPPQAQGQQPAAPSRPAGQPSRPPMPKAAAPSAKPTPSAKPESETAYPKR